MAIDRPSRAKIFFALSVPLIVLAWLFFLLGLLAMIGSDGDAAVGGVLFLFLYALFAAPATALIAAGIWQCGWKNSRWGKRALGILLGVPLIIALLLATAVVISLVMEKWETPKPKQPVIMEKGKP